jgi:hypothetical protein
MLPLARQRSRAENAIERALVFSEGNIIEAEHLPPTLDGHTQGPCIPGATSHRAPPYLTTLEPTGGSTSRPPSQRQCAHGPVPNPAVRRLRKPSTSAERLLRRSLTLVRPVSASELSGPCTENFGNCQRQTSDRVQEPGKAYLRATYESSPCAGSVRGGTLCAVRPCVRARPQVSA